MTVRSILTVLVGGEGDAAALGCSVRVARHSGAHIAAVSAVSSNGAVGDLGLLPEEGGSAVMLEFEKRAKERATRARAAFDTFVRTEAVTISDRPKLEDNVTASWEEIDDAPDSVVEHLGGAYDLIVVGQPERVSGGMAGSGLLNEQIFETATFSTGRPVLVAPAKTPAMLGETVLIGWNRSAQAARAFHASKALLLNRARRVRIVSVTTGAKDGPPAERIAENLAWHGIDCDVRELSPDNRSVGTVLLAEASAIGADLLVAGAYTHSRLRQLLLGDVTQSLLAEAEIPLFFAHDGRE